jgi:plasmid stabilization system protein ParE
VNVVWSVQAEFDLDEIFAFFEYVSPRKAFETVNRIVLAADGLGDFPEMGRKEEDSRFEDLRSFLESPYRIYYRIRDGCVEVASVEDMRRSQQRDWLR